MKLTTLSLKPLTNHQISVIKESWKIIFASSVESGEAIFFTFLTRFPEYQERYSTLTNIPLDELKGTEAMAKHSQKIMQIFNTAINSINDEISFLNSIAQNIKFNGRRGVNKNHYLKIREVIVEVLTSLYNLDDEGKEAWNEFLDSFYYITFNVHLMFWMN